MARTLLIEPISACNLRCKMCPYVSGMTGLSLDKKVISEVLYDISRINSENKSNQFTEVRLDGNTEPLVYKDIQWLIQKCSPPPLENI